MSRKRKAEPDEGASTTPDTDSSEPTTVRDLVAALGRAEAAEDAPAKEQESTVDEAEPTSGLVENLPMDPEDDLDGVEGEASDELTSVVESLVFASPKPVGVRELRKLLKDPTVRQIQLSLKALRARTRDHGVVLQQVAGGFCFRTHPANAPWVQRLLAAKPTRLSRAQLEVLAVIAYRQPITKPEIDHVRGVDCGAVMRGLLEHDLVQIAGRKEEPGRPHLYGTTVRFLELFNLRSLRDLPDLRQARELSAESEEVLRRELDEKLEQERLGQEVIEFGEPEDVAGAEPSPSAEPVGEPG